MDINKAIRKQNSSYKRFVLGMCFIFFILPAALYLSEKETIFLVGYLAAIELLIIFAVIIRSDSEILRYESVDGKIKIKQGITQRNYKINCEKVSFVHAEISEDKKTVNIIILTTSKFRNKYIRPVNSEFLKKYAYVSHEYKKIKMLYPEEQYYYVVISKGGYKKYKFLMDIYKLCVQAKYSSDAIESIKRWNS